MKHIWLIDAGHGGNRSDGSYETAPDKMYEHSPSEIFYEGVFNRQIKDLLIRKCWEEDLDCIDLCPTELDISLPTRAMIANLYQTRYHNCVGISLHSNASKNHKGTGFEIHTSAGENRSDFLASILGNLLVARFPDIKYRKGDVEGEMDKDSLFYILQRTTCPWILPECLFFDNYKDYQKLIDPEFRIRYVKAIIDFMKKAEALNI